MRQRDCGWNTHTRFSKGGAPKSNKLGVGGYNQSLGESKA